MEKRLVPRGGDHCRVLAGRWTSAQKGAEAKCVYLWPDDTLYMGKVRASDTDRHIPPDVHWARPVHVHVASRSGMLPARRVFEGRIARREGGSERRKVIIGMWKSTSVHAHVFLNQSKSNVYQ